MALRLSGCHSVISRHTHRGELAGNLVHRRIQILQLPQIQTAAANQPRSQVPPPAAQTRQISIFVLFAFIRQWRVGVCSHMCSHECHRQEILFSQTAIHFLPLLSLWLPISPCHRQTLNSLLSLPGWMVKASSCCFHSSKWVIVDHFINTWNTLFFLTIQHFHFFFSTFSLYWYYQTHNITIIYILIYINHIKYDPVKYKLIF